MNILITGITGSGGSYLAEYILANHQECKVFGLHRWHSAGSLKNIEHIKDKVTILECDLCDLSSVIRALQISKPEKIFHLASYANVRAAFDTPLAVLNNNINGTANLLEGVRLICPDVKILIASTSEVYGNPKEFPMKETHQLEPVNPYSVSKLTQERLAFAYAKSWGLKVIITRAFAYINFRRKDLFSTAFALQVARIEIGKQNILKHGNVDSVRTLIDVYDCCRAYWLAIEKCEIATPYNIGGDFILSVGDFLEILKSKSRTTIPCFQDKSLMRAVDVTRQIPDTTKFNSLTGFKPIYSVENSIEKLLNDCRSEVINET